MSSLAAALDEARKAAERAREAEAAVRAAADRAIADERTHLLSELATARGAAGLTQQHVADAVGVSRAQIANIERGEGASVETLIGYAAALGLRIALAPLDQNAEAPR